MRYWFSEKSSEIIGAFIGCAAFLLLVAWEERRAVGVFLGAVVALYALTGCAGRLEGDGFSNSGAYQRPAYIKQKIDNIEVWTNK